MEVVGDLLHVSKEDVASLTGQMKKVQASKLMEKLKSLSAGKPGSPIAGGGSPLARSGSDRLVHVHTPTFHPACVYCCTLSYMPALDVS